MEDKGLGRQFQKIRNLEWKLEHGYQMAESIWYRFIPYLSQEPLTKNMGDKDWDQSKEPDTILWGDEMGMQLAGTLTFGRHLSRDRRAPLSINS